jgi:hypothetical protein
MTGTQSDNQSTFTDTDPSDAADDGPPKTLTFITQDPPPTDTAISTQARLAEENALYEIEFPDPDPDDKPFDFLETPHDKDIIKNHNGEFIIKNIHKSEADGWYNLTTTHWTKWTKQYNGSHEPYSPDERYPDPGKRAYKNVRLTLTRLINKEKNDPPTIHDYVKAILSVWDNQGTLGKTPKGQKLRTFIMRVAATWPLNFFLLDWDETGYLHATEDTKAWWAIQKLTGFQCHRRKVFDEAHAAAAALDIKLDPDAFENMDISDNDEAKEINTPSPGKNKRKSHDEHAMETEAEIEAENELLSDPFTKGKPPAKSTAWPKPPAKPSATPPAKPAELPATTPENSSPTPEVQTATPSEPPTVEDPWTTVGAKGRAVKSTNPKFTLPIAQRVLALKQVKIPGSKTQYNTYFDLTINLPKHEKPQKKFLAMLKDMWKNLKELDDDTVWHTYRATSRDTKTMYPITKSSNFPKTFMASRKYLRSLSGVNKEGGKVFTTILIGHNLPPKEIQDCMRDWAIADDHFFFQRTVQAEQVVTVAWGFGSPAKTDCKKFSHLLMEKLNAKFQIGAKDRFMADATKWTKNAPPKDMNRKAIHFEAPEAHALELYRFLVSIYGSTRPIADMPYMLDLKIVPDWTSCKQGKLGAFGTDMLMNCQQMMIKQSLFRKHTEQFPISEIGLLDQPLPDVAKTLREVIMEITVSHTDPTTNATSDERLFHSILPRQKSTDQQLTYPRVHSATAVAMITGLIPFCLHHHGESTKKWFSNTALTGAAGSKWDEKTGTVITPNDKVVQDGLLSSIWWMKDTLTGIEDQDKPEPARPVGRNSTAANRRISTGSQVTFSQNMETTHTYTKDDVSESSEDSASAISIASDPSSESTTSKGQTTGNSTSEEDASGKGSSDESETEKVRKVLLQNPQLLQQLLDKAKESNPKKAKSKQTKKPSPGKNKKLLPAIKITPIKPKKAGTLPKGSGRNT